MPAACRRGGNRFFKLDRDGKWQRGAYASGSVNHSLTRRVANNAETQTVQLLDLAGRRLFSDAVDWR